MTSKVIASFDILILDQEKLEVHRLEKVYGCLCEEISEITVG